MARIPITTITTISSITVKPVKYCLLFLFFSNVFARSSIYRHPSSIPKIKNKGFSFIELVVVIIVLSIIAKFASNLWPGSNINLNAEAQQLASEIRYTQSLAQSRAQRFRINLSSTGYSVTNASGTITYYTDPVKGQNTISFATGTTASWSAAVLPSNLIGFDENGTPYTDSSASTTALSSTATITLTNSGSTRTISVTPGTGRVIVQ